MGWRSAFLSQARSDNEVRRLLNKAGQPYCHELHYLQMSAEKLAQAFMVDDTVSEAPELTHSAIVKFLRVLKTQPQLWRRMGYRDRGSFVALIDSLLPMAQFIQDLAPSIAGTTHPNPEYPWQIVHLQTVVSPCEFTFHEIARYKIQMIKFDSLIEKLLNSEL